nr:ycf20-like protein [Tanacetum cinerariifolium]
MLTESAEKATMKLLTLTKTNNSFLRRNRSWAMTFALNTGGLPTNGDQESVDGDPPSGLGQTRLGRIVTGVERQLLEKLNSARKDFPMKGFSTWMTFRGNTRHLGSFGEETDKTTDLHQTS